MNDNLNRICIVLKLLSIYVSDKMLQTMEDYDTLVCLEYHCNYYPISIDISTEYECYLVFDKVRDKFAQVELASSKLGHKDVESSQRS